MARQKEERLQLLEETRDQITEPHMTPQIRHRTSPRRNEEPLEVMSHGDGTKK